MQLVPRYCGIYVRFPSRESCDHKISDFSRVFAIEGETTRNALKTQQKVGASGKVECKKERRKIAPLFYILFFLEEIKKASGDDNVIMSCIFLRF